MNYSNHLSTYFLIMFILFCIVPSPKLFSQQLGLSIGTGTLNVNSPYDIVNDIYGSENISTPVNINLHLHFPLHKNIKTNISLGYGYSKKVFSTQSDLVPQYWESESKTKGWPLEAELIFHTDIVEKINLNMFMGLGLGYYSYKTEQRNTPVGYRESYAEYKTTGFGQYITFGLDIKISTRLNTFVQFKKLGFSGIELEGDILRYLDTNRNYKSSITSRPGFSDMGIALGLLYHKK